MELIWFQCQVTWASLEYIRSSLWALGFSPEHENNWKSLALLVLRLLPGSPFLFLTTGPNLTPSARLSSNAVFSVTRFYKFSLISSPPVLKGMDLYQ